MKTFRAALIASVIALAAACSSTATKPVAPPAPPPVASIAGNWRLAVQTPMGAVEADMTVVQNGNAISGRLESQMGNVDYNGNIDGSNIKFSYDVGQLGAPAGTRFDYAGTIENGAMKGKATFASFGEGEWSAKRR